MKRSGGRPYSQAAVRRDHSPGSGRSPRVERGERPWAEAKPPRRDERPGAADRRRDDPHSPRRDSHRADRQGFVSRDRGAPPPREEALDGPIWIRGRHEVLAFLKSGKPVESLLMALEARGKEIEEIKALARARAIKVQALPMTGFRQKVGSESQGVALRIGAFPYADFETLLQEALRENGLLLVLNHVEDPRNLGAIVRTAEAAGVAGVVIPKNRAAGMTEWAIRTSQGAAAHLPVARVTNIGVVVERLKQEGFWCYGLDEDAVGRYDEIRYNARMALVIGGEDAGLGEKVKGLCDECVRIPMLGKTPSLNVAVSAGIVLFEVLRQRGFPPKKTAAN